MIKIRKNFIQSSDGAWYNINLIGSFYLGGDELRGYQVCFSPQPIEPNFRNYLDYRTIGQIYKEKHLAEEQLDGIIDAIDYVDE